MCFLQMNTNVSIFQTALGFDEMINRETDRWKMTFYMKSIKKRGPVLFDTKLYLQV